MFHKISIDTRNYYGIALDLVFHFGLSAFKLVLWLRFWNLGVPYRQVTTFFVLKKFLKLCDKNSITVWAVYGTLLGAYRSQSFAGRPSDIDFIIQVKLISYFRFRSNSGYVIFHCFNYVNRFCNVKCHFYYVVRSSLWLHLAPSSLL